MRFKDLTLTVFAGLFGILTASGSPAGELIEVVKSEGSVEVRQQDQQAGADAETRSVLSTKYILVTGRDGRAVVRVGQSGYVVVERNSTIEINKSGNHANLFRQVTGMIFYAMNSIRGKLRPPIKIRTNVAIIGIRGTRFLVADLQDRKEIGVRKGSISVTSPGEEFEIHRKAQEDEFAAFKKEAQDAIDREKREFSEYQAENEREFIEYKREFGLAADRMATFDGRRVTERTLSGESKKDMESLESYAAEWIKEVRD